MNTQKIAHNVCNDCIVRICKIKLVYVVRPSDIFTFITTSRVVTWSV